MESSRTSAPITPSTLGQGIYALITADMNNGFRLDARLVRIIAELRTLVRRAKRAPTEPKAARKKYGATLIRIDWQYAGVAFNRPELKHVCTWPNGDEGFVFVRPNRKAKPSSRNKNKTTP